MKQFLRFAGYYGRKRMQPIYLILTMMFLLAGIGAKRTFGQDRLSFPQKFIDLKGVVLDSVNHKPIVHAHLLLTGDFSSYIDVYTDTLGRFDFRGVHLQEGSLKIVPPDSIHAVKEIKIGPANNGPYRIYLGRAPVILEEVEVVSTGFWQVPKERATGSFVHLDNELLSRSVGSNVLDRLNGITRGLTFNQAAIGNTQVYNQSSMSIRGRSTINANAEPLIILDNFPYEGDIDAINPEDIESVTVLEDASAASIWGARAGNGVIVLTSKKGRFEQPLRISVRGDWSMSPKPDLYYTPTIPIPELIEIDRFLFEKGAWDSRINQVYPYITPTVEAMLAHRNGHIDSLEMEFRLAQLKTRDVRRDLQNYVYRPTALYKTALSMRGGSKNNSFYVSAGYDKNDGDIRQTNSQRITLKADNMYNPIPGKLSVNAGFLFSTNRNRVGGQNLNHYQVLYDRLADEEGNALSIGGGENVVALRQSYVDTAGAGLLQDWSYRPLEEMNRDITATDLHSYQMQGGIRYLPLPWLTTSLDYRYTRMATDRTRFNDETSFAVRHAVNRFSVIDPAGNVTSAIPKGGRLSQSVEQKTSQYLRGQVGISKKWKDQHTIDIISGIEINEQVFLGRSFADLWGYSKANESHLPIWGNETHREYYTGYYYYLPVTYDSRKTTTIRNRLFYGNASYSYSGRYSINLSARKDEANIFGAARNLRGRPFWSAGFRWTVSHEPFFRVPWLDNLVARVTYGQMGNVSNNSAHITSRVSQYPYSRTGRNYHTITNPPNPQLGWEKVSMANVALDFSALSGRLRGNIEFYMKTAEDLLGNAPVNPSSGVGSFYGNWSSLRGSGWDLGLHSENLVGNFSWTSNLILSVVRDKITDYKLKPSSDDGYLTGSLGQYPIEGKPLYGIYSLPSAGLDMDGQPRGYLHDEISNDYTAIYNGTGLGGFVFHGRGTPSVFGGLRNGFSFHGLTCSFNITYKFGYYYRRQGLDYGKLYSVTNYSQAAFLPDYARRWREAGDETATTVPVAQYPVDFARERFYAMSSVLVEKADHVRLSDIRLAYSFPAVGLGGLGLREMTIYAYASNLGILWRANESGIDPDAVPANRLVYPLARSYALGITLNF